MNKQLVEISKFLSFVLRHNPLAIGITLDAEGWVPVDELVTAAARHGQSISREQLDEVVATNDKKRFSFRQMAGSSGRTRATASRWIWAWCPSNRPSCCTTAPPSAFSTRSVKKA